MRSRMLSLLAAAVVCGWSIGALASAFVAHAAGCPVEGWTGTSGPDVRYDDTDGVDEDNQWFALDGSDLLRSLACDDSVVRGEGGGDDLGGGSGSDYVEGDGGNDTVAGGAGNDSLFGNDDADSLQDNQTGDTDDAHGGPGDDPSIDVQDGDGNDSADGGLGSDHCVTDGGDSRSGCES